MNQGWRATDLYRDSPLRPLAEAAGLSVWDVGARGGVDSGLAPFAWCTRAVAFEPDPVAAEGLRGTPAPWARVDIVTAAVAGHDGNRILHVTDDPSGSSLLSGRPEVAARYGVEPLYRVTKRLEVPCITLATAFERHSPAPPSLLKLDVEGAELEILQGGGSVVDHAIAIKTEAAFLRTRDGQPMAWELCGWLADRGFALMDIGGDVHYWRRGNVAGAPYVARRGGWSRGRLAQADLIFLRDLDGLDDDGGPTSAAMRTALVSIALGYLDHARDILDRPKAKEGFRALTGRPHGPVLAKVAETAGRRDVGRTIRARLRDLIPLLRSRFGGVPMRRMR